MGLLEPSAVKVARSVLRGPRRSNASGLPGKRNGTTTLFAALDVLSGTVIGQCLPRHTNNEFVHFLRKVDKEGV